MKLESKVLLVDDHIGDIGWLIDLIESLGYKVDHVANEEDAKRRILAVKKEGVKYAMAIIDIMVSTQDIMNLVELDAKFFEKSMDTGVRLCRYAREELRLLDDQLHIVCITARNEDDVRPALDELGIRLYSRISQNSDDSIRSYVKERLPRVE